jgi:hypothetical protein
MKKMFTKLFSAAILAGLLITGITAKAQTTYASSETLHKKTKAKADSAAAATADKKAKTISSTTQVADPVDTAWHPQRRVWGYAFGDAYYDQHSPSLTATPVGGTLGTNTLGKENNYYETPTNRNAFQFRRIYLGYDYEINKKFKAEVLLASEPSETLLQ